MARRKKQPEEEASNENPENQDNQDIQQNQDSINSDSSDDAFGLPEVEYEPIQRDEPLDEPLAESDESLHRSDDYAEPREEEPIYSVREEHTTSETSYHDPIEEDHQEYHSRYSYMEENKQPMWPKILLLVLVLIVAAGTVYYFAYYQPKKTQEEKIARELSEKRRAEEAALADRQRLAEQKRLEDEQRRADSLANVSRVGSVERLSGRTGQYWVIVASAIDDDLLMDFAQKLSKEGKQVKIIPPFGKKGKFHRLAIESRGSYEEAQATADGLKGGEFGDQLWVVRY